MKPHLLAQIRQIENELRNEYFQVLDQKDKIDLPTQVLSFLIESTKILTKKLSKKNKEFNNLKKSMLSKQKNLQSLRKDLNNIN